MKSWSILLILLVLATPCAVPAVAPGLNREHPNPSNQESRNPTIQCSVRTNHPDWRLQRQDAEVFAEISLQGNSQITALASLHLVAVPKTQELIQEEYWAPFDMKTGTTVKAKQKVQPTDAKRPVPVRLFPSRLVWASTKSSVWPSLNLAKAVPRGRYLLRIEIELENGKTVKSNDIEINVIE